MRRGRASARRRGHGSGGLNSTSLSAATSAHAALHAPRALVHVASAAAAAATSRAWAEARAASGRPRARGFVGLRRPRRRPRAPRSGARGRARLIPAGRPQAPHAAIF